MVGRYFTILVLMLLTSPTRADDTHERFRRLDRNQDGKVTRDEFSKPLFDQIDADKDGRITAEEYQSFAHRRNSRRAQGQPRTTPETVNVVRDIPYAATDNPRQQLDIFLPKTAKSDKPLPMVVYIHGGGWHSGSKSGGYRHVGPLVESGEYAGASIGYRLTHEATWPAQIHDCKAAIRWLRANAGKYNIDADRIGVVGTSAGGHLVAMLGTSGDVESLDGSLGPHLEKSSRVTCVADLFGPSDLLALGGRHDDPKSPGAKLLGGAIPEKKEVARDASPITYVSTDDPPFLMIHGTDDPIVPFSQSVLLKAALDKAQVEALLIPIEGGGHGVSASAEPVERMKRFFDKHLLGRSASVSIEPIKAARTK